jgi:hypothetical protein
MPRALQIESNAAKRAEALDGFAGDSRSFGDVRQGKNTA